MANICSNTAFVKFSDNTNVKEGDRIIEQICKEDKECKTEYFNVDDVYSENYNESEFYSFEMCFDSKWSAPVIALEDLAKKYSLDIIGVSTEFSCGYVDTFEFYYADKCKVK